MCAITLWLRALFRSRTLPETMIAIEAREAMFSVLLRILLAE